LAMGRQILENQKDDNKNPEEIAALEKAILNVRADQLFNGCPPSVPFANTPSTDRQR
jgi:hypothetical protein